MDADNDNSNEPENPMETEIMIVSFLTSDQGLAGTLHTPKMLQAQ